MAQHLDTYWWISFRTRQADAELDQDRLFELGATGIEEPEDRARRNLRRMTLAPRRHFSRMQPAFAGGQGRFRGQVPSSTQRRGADRGLGPELAGSANPGGGYPLPDGGPALGGSGPAPGMSSAWRPRWPSAPGPMKAPASRPCFWRACPWRARSVLDIGTGTGILALYAGLLGAGRILALDIDPVTGPCLRENLALNPLPAGCPLPALRRRARLPARNGARFDLIVCNMIRTELWPFREELRRRLKPGGHFVVSGQRLEDKPHFLAWQRQSPFAMVTEDSSLDAWWGFAARAD